MVRVPKFTANAGARYAFDLAGGWTSVSANVYHTSKFYFDSSNDYSQKGYTLLGLRAEWTDPAERTPLAFFGENLTNADYRIVLQNTHFRQCVGTTTHLRCRSSRAILSAARLRSPILGARRRTSS